MEQAAEQWNEALGSILAKDLDELKAEFADRAVAGPDEAAGATDGADRADGVDGTDRTR
ncbi:hypothetical protein OG978_25035 [Streptomyces sp. NBC_01591]|uniref:hypothetical protein n=1 Tax=Streptomyces sp. NBC_01591 TaxID=2975888 RepID=UPI002DDC8203|nr:hypothetical protein [Streptomyces sp. NBC_01591]WSD70354.1 hypothetical protein OG978_25035 [Streptomyces sp. NBC_01591]